MQRRGRQPLPPQPCPSCGEPGKPSRTRPGRRIWRCSSADCERGYWTQYLSAAATPAATSQLCRVRDLAAAHDAAATAMRAAKAELDAALNAWAAEASDLTVGQVLDQVWGRPGRYKIEEIAGVWVGGEPRLWYHCRRVLAGGRKSTVVERFSRSQIA